MTRRWVSVIFAPCIYVKNFPDINILPSLIAANMGHLAEACQHAASAGADGMHIDIMDGHFVPNLTLGPDMVRMCADAAPGLYRHVHLMVTHPQELADAFIDAGSQTLLFHVEARVEPAELIAHLRSRNVVPGLVVNPETPAHALEPYLGLVDEILVMTVHPGFGGQAFMTEVLPKIATIRQMAPDLPVSIDGGVTLNSAPLCAEQGASILIAGTALFKAADMAADIRAMRDACHAAYPSASI